MVKGRPVPFSFWPMYRGERRFGLQSVLLVRDPWTVMRDAVESRCPKDARTEAHACLEQAKDFYSSAMSANVAAARPLQLYYCFLNLAKTLALTNAVVKTLNWAHHGLRETPGGNPLVDDCLEVVHRGNRPLVFDLLHRAITASPVPASVTTLSLQFLLPQILPGHRLWAAAADREVERFVRVHDLRFMDDDQKNLWLRAYVVADDLTRLGATRKGCLAAARLTGLFRAVDCNETVDGRRLNCFEQIRPSSYGDRPSDRMPSLVEKLKSNLWVTVASTPPYRHYYLYMAPDSERSAVLPQLLSVYSVMFYLGSITRYRPQVFDQILKTPFGALIEEFIAGQPTQFIYLMASEFAKREVTQPAIV